MLIALVAFKLKSAYGVHTQPLLLNNLSHRSSNYLTASTYFIFSFLSPPNLRFFCSFCVLWFFPFLQHSHRTYSKLMCNDKIQPLSMNYSTWYFKINTQGLLIRLLLDPLTIRYRATYHTKHTMQTYTLNIII